MLTDRDRTVLADDANDESPTTGEPDGVVNVFHYSEIGSIRRFVPQVRQTSPSQPAAVWAIDAAHSPLYWFPRDCPRISVWADEPHEQTKLTDLFGTEARYVCAAETGWLDGVRQARLFRYVFDAAHFEPSDDAGQYVAYDVVHPERIDQIDDVLALHAAADVELRFTPRLGALMDRILQSGLPFGSVRIRDAKR